MKKKGLIIIFALVACVLAASAQNRRALRINEVMVQNDSNIVDEYGCHEAWIELFNGNFGPLEISSIYLTNDSTNKKMYPVPLGDEKTRIGKRQHVLFYANGDATKGTFHTNFKLTPGQDNWIGIYDADGTTLIDSVVIPASLLADQSYARVSDGADEWGVRDGKEKETAPTPSSANIATDTNNKIEMFARIDGHGFGMAAMAMLIVFSSLLVLCLAFMAISKIGAKALRKNKAKVAGEVSSKKVASDSGEEIAAICMALNQHLNTHDTENTVLTIKRLRRAYSPWSSKIYGLRHMPK